MIINDSIKINEIKSINVGNGSTAYKSGDKYYIKKGDSKKEISADQYNKLRDLNKELAAKSKLGISSRASDVNRRRKEIIGSNNKEYDKARNIISNALVKELGLSKNQVPSNGEIKVRPDKTYKNEEVTGKLYNYFKDKGYDVDYFDQGEETKTNNPTDTLVVTSKNGESLEITANNFNKNSYMSEPIIRINKYYPPKR